MSSNFELPSSVDSLSYERSQDNFNRLKATSKKYEWGRNIKYWIFSRIKEIGVRLDPQRETKVELYNQHFELCSQIERVDKAYRAYRQAEKDVRGAEDLRAARQREFRKAEAFVKSYDALIGLAGQQSARFRIFRNPYLQDLHEALAQKGNIFSAVHRARAKLYLGNGLLEDTQKRYIDFVGCFTQHVRQATRDSGSSSSDNIQMITDGLIDGLISIPEVNLVHSIMGAIIKLDYLQNPSQIPSPQGRQSLEREVAQLRDEVTQSLSQQLIILINSDSPLSIADLSNIQHRGISLCSVLGDIEESFERLENLQILWKKLQEVQKQARLNIDQKRQLERSIIIDSTFTVAELQSLSAPEDFSPDYQKVARALAALDKKISGLHEAEKRELAALSISKQREKVQKLEAHFNQLNTDVQNLSDSIETLQKDLAAYKAEDPVQQFNRLNKAQQRECLYLYGYNFTNEAQERFEAQIKKKEDAIREKKWDLRELQKDLSQCQESLNTAKIILTSLFEDESLGTSLDELEVKIKYNKERKPLMDERKKIAESLVQLSEEELRLLAESHPEGALGDQIRRGCEEFSKKPVLVDRLRELNEETQEIKNTLARRYPNFDPATGKFSDAFFEMGDVLQSNFAIAQEVHAKVNDRLGQPSVVPFKRMTLSAFNPLLSELVNPFTKPQTPSTLSTISESDSDTDYSSDGQIELEKLLDDVSDDDFEGEIDLEDLLED